MADLGAIGKTTDVGGAARIDPFPPVTLSEVYPGSVRGFQITKNQENPILAELASTKIERHVAAWEGRPDWYYTTSVEGSISGTVAIGVIPAPYSVVNLYYRVTGQLIYSTKTDKDAKFSFPHLDPLSNEYFCVAYDPSAVITYDSLLFDRVTPIVV